MVSAKQAYAHFTKRSPPPVPHRAGVHVPVVEEVVMVLTMLMVMLPCWFQVPPS